MVNVGGRSKGCATCRKRRVKCDETRPACARCQRWNLPCDGPKAITFIKEDGKRFSKASKSVIRNAGETDAQAWQIFPATLSVRGPEVYICYTQNHLMPNGLIFSAIQDLKADDLVSPRTVIPARRVSSQAILSFATILFGTQHRQDDITGQGYAMHGIALQELNRALSNDSSCTQDGVILAVAALAISECLVPTGPENYLTHMMGLERLLELRGPEAFSFRGSSAFCKGVRFMVLFASLQLGRPSVLARQKWKTAWRLGQSFEELQEQDLFDILADCTVLIAKRDSALAAPCLDVTKTVRVRQELMQQAESLRAELHAWKRRRTPGSRDFQCGKTRQIDDPGLFAWIDDVDLASLSRIKPDEPTIVMLMLYNIALLYVLQIWISLASWPASTKDLSPCLRTIDDYGSSIKDKYYSEERTTALALCRYLQHYLNEKNSLHPGISPIIHWALISVWKRFCCDNLPEGAWLRELLSTKGRQVVAKGLWATYVWLCQVTT